MSGLVLSLFPGIDLFGRGFEEEGFSIVRGPDLLWGGDVHRFHVPAGRFDGVIGGPPCKGESNLAHLNGSPGVSLRHEFMRVVKEASPRWFVMEAVKRHADIPGSAVCLSPRWLGELQSRRRWFHSDLPLHRHVEVQVFEPVDFKHAVVAGHEGKVGTVSNGIAKYHWPEACALQGLPLDFDLPGFKRDAKYEALGNGVPVQVAREVARAVKRALECTECAA